MSESRRVPDRIGMIAPRYAPAIGGVERHVQRIAEGLTACGLAVDVITTDPDGKLPPLEVINGVTVRRFPTLGRNSVYFVSPALGSWLMQHAREFRLLHAHSYHTPLALQAAIASRTAKVPLMLTPHYHGTGHTPFRRALHIPYRLAGSWLIRQARRVICVSRVEQALIQTHFGKNVPTVVIPNGIDLIDYSQYPVPALSSDQVRILSVGRLEAYKQTDRILSALEGLSAEYTLTVVGDGPERANLADHAARLSASIGSRLQLRGHIPQSDLYALYRSADVFVSLSRHEAFGLTLLEAAAAGAALVASDIPAHREVAAYLPAQRVVFVDVACTPAELGQAIAQAARTRQSGLLTRLAAAHLVGCRGADVGLLSGARQMINRWGRLPDLSLVIAGGLLLIAEGDTLARQASPWGSILFWIGLLTVYIPVTARLLMPQIARREQVGLLVLLGLALYAVKLMHSPLDFTFADEFAHWRTVNDILQSGHLFQKNPLLPVAHLYPGLANVTDALVRVGRFSIFEAGVLVLAAARIVLILALYLFYEEASRSARIAGLAVLLYMANPNFVFFDAQFAYEIAGAADHDICAVCACPPRESLIPPTPFSPQAKGESDRCSASPSPGGRGI